MFSFHVIWKSAIVGVTLLVLGWLYFRNKKKTNKVLRLSKLVDSDHKLAMRLFNELNNEIMTLDIDYNDALDKLKKLKYELEFFNHTVHKCHKYNDDNFLIITTYQYLETYGNGIESIKNINYRFHLDKKSKKLTIFSDDDITLLRYKRIFVAGFFKYCFYKVIDIS